MRTYGRLTDELGKKTWVEVQTDVKGFNDYVYITTLIQVLLLNLGESPFFANYGIPAHPSVVLQLFPDFYVSFTQRQFSAYFASLIISKLPTFEPTYNVSITTNQGAVVSVTIPE